MVAQRFRAARRGLAAPGRRAAAPGRRRAALAVAMAGTALLGTTLLAATPALADSADCAAWGPHKGVAIGATAPSGVYCFDVENSGHRVLNTYGKYYFTSITLHAALYHEREVVRFYNKKNVNYATFMEPAYPGWRYGNADWTTNLHGTLPSGRVCGSLRGNGKVLATICESLP